MKKLRKGIILKASGLFRSIQNAEKKQERLEEELTKWIKIMSNIEMNEYVKLTTIEEL